MHKSHDFILEQEKSDQNPDVGFALWNDYKVTSAYVKFTYCSYKIQKCKFLKSQLLTQIKSFTTCNNFL